MIKMNMHYRHIKEPSIEYYFLLIIITEIKLVIRGVLNNGLSPESSAGVYVLLALCGDGDVVSVFSCLREWKHFGCTS